MPRVYVGKLSHHVREKDIQRLFSDFGKLLQIDLKNGYGFVDFLDNQDADDAVYELNGKELYGERVVIEHARGPRSDRHAYGGGGYRGVRASRGYSSRRQRGGREKYGPPVRTEYRLIVENLSSRCSWQDLKDFMRQAGEVTFAHKERTNLGVIEFRTRYDMKRAIEKLDGTDIKGRKIRLVEDKSRRPRRSHSRSRSRSRSARRRSRSRSRRSRKSHSRSSAAYSERRHERHAKTASKSPSPSEDRRPVKSPSPTARSASPSHSKSPSSHRSASQD